MSTTKTKKVTTKLANPTIESIKANLDAMDYITTLEQGLIKAVSENSTPSSRLVRSFNPGPNPLDFSLEMQKETILAEMRAKSPRVSIFCPFDYTVRQNLLELSLFDVHIGKLGWDKEVGEDYDIDIAVDRYMAAIGDLVSRVNTDTIERILLPIGNDMLNVDGKSGTTTNGTPQDGDSRFGKMFSTCKKLIIDTVAALMTIAPVDIVVVPGNHDEMTMFTLGEVLDAWFHNNSAVNVYNSPKLRKYYQYGKCMLMFTHGNKEKHSELGMIAAAEEPMMWATTKYREVHVGHFHKSKSISYVSGDEFQGFKVRILPSLSGTDAWHYSKGYMSAKCGEAYLWNKERGLMSTYYYNL